MAILYVQKLSEFDYMHYTQNSAYVVTDRCIIHPALFVLFVVNMFFPFSCQ